MDNQQNTKKKGMNLPNKLTVMRLCLVPVFVVIMMLSNELWATIAGLLIFIIASLTDMLDGKIARKYNLVTDFGKFLDPLADKFMVIGALLVIVYKTNVAGKAPIFTIVFFWATLIVIFRELAVTSMRLMVSGKSGKVIAANMLGKIKTCTQIACIIVCIVEPTVYDLIGSKADKMASLLPVSLVLSALMIVFTLWSGLNYIISYWSLLDPNK